MVHPFFARTRLLRESRDFSEICLFIGTFNGSVEIAPIWIPHVAFPCPRYRTLNRPTLADSRCSSIPSPSSFFSQRSLASIGRFVRGKPEKICFLPQVIFFTGHGIRLSPCCFSPRPRWILYWARG